MSQKSLTVQKTKQNKKVTKKQSFHAKVTPEVEKALREMENAVGNVSEKIEKFRQIARKNNILEVWINQMIRNAFRDRMTKDQLYYLTHTEEKKEQSRENRAKSRNVPNNEDKKDIEHLSIADIAKSESVQEERKTDDDLTPAEKKKTADYFYDRYQDSQSELHKKGTEIIQLKKKIADLEKRIAELERENNKLKGVSK